MTKPMNPLSTALSFLLIGLASAQNRISDTWTFESGNLIANWSFEEIAPETSWEPPAGGITAIDRYPRSDAPSGSFVLRMYAHTGGTESPSTSQKTAWLPVLSATEYRYSIKVNAATADDARGRPEFRYLTGDKATSAGSHTGCTEYRNQVESDGTWNEYICDFTTPSSAQFLSITFLRREAGDGPEGTLYLDDVYLREKDAPDAILSQREFGNASGRPDQTVVRSNPGTQLITHYEYDNLGRPLRTYLPVKNHGLSNFFYLLVGTREPNETLNYDFPTVNDAYRFLESYAATKILAELPSSFDIKIITSYPSGNAPMSIPGRLPRIYSSDNQLVPVRLQGMFKYQGEYFWLQPNSQQVTNEPLSPLVVLSLLEQQYGMSNRPYSQSAYSAPGSPISSQVAPPGPGYEPEGGHVTKSGWAFVNDRNRPTNPEIDGNETDAEMDYLYSWSKDPMGFYQLAWTDRNGNVVKKEQNSVDAATWARTEFNFNAYDQITSSLSPTDYAKSYTGYDGEGRLLEESENDRGRRTYAYDDQGRPYAFNQYSSSGSPLGQVLTDYDLLDRVTSTGHSKDRGFIYDELTAQDFLLKTGLSLASMGLGSLSLENTKGKLACSYNKNSPLTSYSPFPLANRLVAAFYSYDDKSRVSRIIQYLGPISTNANRIQETRYEYDELDRVKKVSVMKNYQSLEVVDGSYFMYDREGRVSSVYDHLSRPKVGYQFDDLGRLTMASLHGCVRIHYKQDIQGKLRELKYLMDDGTSRVVFGENIGYETKAHSEMPTEILHQPRWDGKISGTLQNYGQELSDPTRRWLYRYNAAGQLIRSDLSTFSLSSLTATGEVKYSNPGSPILSRVNNFQFDADAKILGLDRDGHHYSFNYPSTAGGTFRLASVSGSYPATPRDMRSANNFVYDGAGRIIDDLSLDKGLDYNAESQPVRIQTGSRSFLLFYDGNGRRIATWEIGANVGKVYVRHEDGDIAKEITQNPYEVLKTRIHAYGANSEVGYYESSPTNMKLLIRDHLGSTVKTISMSNPASLDHHTYAYSEFGKKTNLRVAAEEGPTTTFTGKEFDEIFNTTDFGARQYDQDLGVWLTPDAAEQFTNAYSYTGGDPINGIDPDGNWAVWDDLIAAFTGAVAGYVGYGMATGEWGSWKSAGMAATGAAAGWAALYTGGATASALAGSIGAINATVAAGVVGGAAGGAIFGGGGFAVQNAGTEQFTASNVVKASLNGAASGAASGFVGGAFGAVAGSAFSGGMMSSTIGGAVGGYAAGFGTSMYMGESLVAAHQDALISAATSAAGPLGAKVKLSNPKTPSGPPQIAQPKAPLQQPPGKIQLQAPPPAPKLNMNSLKEIPSMKTTISQKQFRHIEGRKEWVQAGKGGYFKSMNDAQKVLDAAHDGSAKVLGFNKAGHPVVEYNGVTGYNNNPKSGYTDQPTNVFVIKGSESPSIVPTSPNWKP